MIIALGDPASSSGLYCREASGPFRGSLASSLGFHGRRRLPRRSLNFRRGPADARLQNPHGDGCVPEAGRGLPALHGRGSAERYRDSSWAFQPVKVVLDTSPVCYLFLIGEVEILPALYDRLLVPPAVVAELGDPEAPQALRNWMASPPAWLEVYPVRP